MPDKNPYQQTISESLAKWQSNTEGLTQKEAKKRQLSDGTNELIQKKKKPAWVKFILQFKDLMILILVTSAVISSIIGSLTDTVIILIIVLANAIIGFVQEYQAGKAIDALRQMNVHNSMVIRDGKWQELPSIELVTGDIIQLEAGKMVTADLRLVEAYALRIDESALTGESVPVDKSIDPIAKNKIPLGDQTNMAFKGTSISNGRGIGLVVATGMKTELGKIAGLLQEEVADTPLKRRMTAFSKKLTFLILIICAIIFGFGIYRGEAPMNMLLISISLAVAAIPEALPALITMALSQGASRMAKQKALVRTLPSVETLGSVNYICSDKTGTLTANKMTVTNLEQSEFQIPGLDVPALTFAMALNQDVKGKSLKELTGDPTELALVLEVIKQKEISGYKHFLKSSPRVAELPFDSERKMMSTIHSFDGKFILITKGATESIAHTLKSKSDHKKAHALSEEWAKGGNRVIAFAGKILDKMPTLPLTTSIETDLQFFGLVGMIDPPRLEVKASILECQQAGIKLVMITGDHPETASAIAREIGILLEGDKTLSGSELEELSETKFQKQVEDTTVYSRVSPQQKLRIIQALKKKGHSVAMTGDGVNDGPSLREADIGIAMGKNGTDVAKEAANLILLDDHFETIVHAVKEGRRIYDNIRKFIRYIMSCNSAEIWIIFLAPFFGLPLPLLPIHILWINLVTDGLPGLALASEQAEKDVMKRAPTPIGENIFSHGLGVNILWIGLLMTGLTLGIQAWCIHTGNGHWQTMVFTVLSLSQLSNALASRSDRELIYVKGIFTNRFLLITLACTFMLQLGVIYLPFCNTIFHTEPLSLGELAICIGLAAILFHAIEIVKWIWLKWFAKSL